MTRVKRIAVFASGSGSNYEALMEYLEDSSIEVALLVCNKPQAYVLERARRWGTPTFVFSTKEYESKQAYEQAIFAELERYQIDFIVLAGYMRLLGATILHPYQGRIVNIHPSLLPAFPGKDAIGQAIEYGVRVSGITIHYVDEGMDTGPIIDQYSLPVRVDETKETLAAKLQELEHQFYPKVIEACVRGKVQLEGGNVRWTLQSNER